MSSQNSEKESGDENIKDSTSETSAEKLTLESLSANSDSSSDVKFGILLGLIKVDGINEKDIIDTTFSLLIDGTFDLELNFVINSSENINYLVQVIDQCPRRVQAEIWSVFIAMVKKSKRNVLACAQAQLIEKVLSRLADADSVLTEILVELLSILATFSITVKEMKSLLSLLKTKQGTWSQDALKLLEVLKLMLVRHGPDEFFSFPGKKGSAIAIPPISKWPYQNGWTINCWFQLDPITGSHIEREKPYLYCFCTSKGVGYSGHFLGSTFVITAIKMKGKGYQHCVQFEFQPRKWYMLSIVHVYNRWSKSEIRCYVDGQLVSQGEMSWFVNTNDQFDRCFIGSSPEQELDSMFSGQISSIYGFSDALSPQQIQAIFALGAGYKGQFKFHKESQLRLGNSQSKVLYEGRLQSAIVFLYNPVACDGSLSLDQTPRANPSIFVHSSHAMMSGEVTPVVTQSINASLHSLGGIQALFPLFSQLDCEQPGPKGKDEGKNISTVLMSLIYDLLNHSQFNQQQFQHSRGFLVISQYLEKSSPRHLNADVLNIFIALSKLLMSSSSTATLLRQLYNYILFNPPLWIRASIDVQIRLYYYLSVEFVTSAKIFTKLRRISAVLHILHTLKYYYWIANPRDRSGIIPKTPENMERPDIGSLVTIRSSMLVFMKHLILREDQGGGIHDDEMQAILNYLTTVNEDDNLQDVLRNTMNLMHDSPASMVPAFDRKNGISTVFKLLSSPNERIRINTLKLLGFFLRRSTHKRKHDTMGPHNLFSLVGERLLLYCPFLTMATYNALFEILTERVTKDSDSHDKPDSSIKLENPLMLKVIADLIRQSKPTPELLEVKTTFLSDLTRLCESSKENRRTVLQMSVWQDWLFGLAPLAWKSEAEEATADMVMGLLRTLLYHAIKCEYGGWRVWVDTLAVLHSRISYEDFRLRMSQVYREYADLRNDASDENQPLNSVSRASDRVRNHVTTQTRATEDGETGGHRVVKDVLDKMVSVAVGEDDEEESNHSNCEMETSSTAGETDEKVEEQGEKKLQKDEEEERGTRDEEEEDGDERVVRDVLNNVVSEVVKEGEENSNLHNSCQNTEEGSDRENSESKEVLRADSATGEAQRKNSATGEAQRKNSATGEAQRKNSATGEAQRKNSATGEAQGKNSTTGEAQGKNSATGEVPRRNSVAGDVQRRNSATGEAQRKNSATGDAQRRNSVTPAASKVFSPGPQAPPFRIPEFRWSLLHQRLLAEVLECVEEDVIAWKSDGTKTILENVNSPENHVYVINLIHLVSQLSDTLVTSCGGLLPLLAVATSPGDEIDMLEVGQGLKMDVAVRFMLRIMLVADVVVFASSQNFAELENDKNMANGAILRQCLRLVATCAVLNCFECRYRPLVVSRNDGQSNEHEVMYREALPPNSIQGLLKGMLLSPSNTPYTDRYQPPPKDQEMLLQDLDINRLRATVYRAVEDNKQAQFLSLAIVYFVSVLMVSKYRDILEPPTPLSTPANSQVKILTASGSLQTLSGDSDLASQSGVPAPEDEATVNVENSEGPKETPKATGDEEQAPAVNNEREEEEKAEEEEELQEPASVKENGFHAEEKTTSIAAIAGTTTQPESGSPGERPNQLSLPAMPGQLPTSSNHEGSLTQRLERALGSAAPLLREIFIDFAAFLSKTLLGSHGQELVSGGLVTLRQSSSVVELVMLLCSQEWQNSLQKNAGLAFIELVNEGRLLSHATRDHIVRVSNEAEYILNRMRAEDVQKHAEFGQLAAQRVNERREEEKMCDHLVTSARQRDASIAKRLQLKLLNIISKEHGFWGSTDKGREEFCRLDTWEDDSRRRRRLVPNPYGSNHADATLRAAIEHGASEEEVAMAKKATLSSVRGGGLLEDGSHGVTDEELCADNTSSGGSAGVSPSDTQSVGSGGGSSSSGNAVNNVGAAEMELAGPVSLSTRCVLLAPGVSVNGTLAITESELFFEMDNEDERNRNFDDAVLQYVDQIHGKWNFAEIRAIFSRRYLHKNVALEIFMANRSAVMFALPDQAAVKQVVNCLPRVGIGVKYGLPQTRKSSLASPRQIFKHSNMTGKWQRREISNFDYLMYLNTVAGRSFNDLNQYPVFPWVLANYDVTELDLSQPSNYRDLSKPIGALNPSRKAFFDERYATWDDDSQPAFHYGTHYSTAAFVLNYLVRVEPFTTIFLSLQGSKFDHADRTFHSMGQSWANCQRDTSDVKELIPEFFYLPEMLRNDNGYNLGVTDTKLQVNDVLLPNWAATPEDFVRINRMALESELVSCQLHQWIDLVFGYKQRGPEAVRATNVFYHLTYEGSLDWSKVTDPVLKQALEDQIRNFGQTPSQLLTEPHPPRNSALHVSPMMFAAVQEDVCMVMKFLSNSPVVAVAANTHPAVPSPAVVTIAANHSYAVNRWNNAAAASIQQAPNLGNNAGPNSDAQVRLPLSMDSHLAMSLQSSRRHLGDNFDERLPVTSAQFATTPDNRTLFACGYWDKSFRVYALETCRIVQVIYGHFGVVTCLARSECNFNQDCYVVTGSQDCSVVLWLWSNKHQAILGGLDGTDCDTPTPRATLTGHQEAVSCVCVSAELGIIVSGSTDGVCLLHTTHGDLLRTLPRPEVPGKDLVPRLATYNREGLLVVQFGPSVLVTYTLNGRLMRMTEGEEEVSAVVLSRCGQYIVMATQAGIVIVRRSHDLNLLYSFPACDAPIRALGLTHDQRFLLAGLASGCLVVFNIDFNKWHHEFQERYS